VSGGNAKSGLTVRISGAADKPKAKTSAAKKYFTIF